MPKPKEWGGRREGAGRKASWKSGKCKPVKLPVALVGEVLRYARELDEGGAPRPATPPPAALPLEAAAQAGVAAADPAVKASWTQVLALLNEKQDLEKRVRHLLETLAQERKRIERLEASEKRQETRIADARSILHHAYLDHRRGVRKGITVSNVRSALLSLGLDVDAPPPGSPS